ncbi:VOC family protein [Aegicerativicinus sediminis]|uniref:VOC family protein n=1 Tax=Aegicerativicinus sediminis TaxID=2893202 RepID=UPI001E549699|nr:VOC family protein [Aegicerativicinus sediminis]
MKKEKILGLRTIVYVVKDLKAAKEWYSEVFDTKPYFDFPFYVGFNIGGYELGLLPIEKETLMVGNNSTTYWAVQDIDKAFKQFIDAGATEVEEPHSVGENLQVASVKDPWQNIIGLIFNPYFKPE